MIDTRTVRGVVIAAVLYWTAVGVLLHVLEPEVDPVIVPMSAYVDTGSGALMTTTYWASAIALTGIAVGLRRLLPRTVLPTIGFVVFSIAALGTIVAGVFPGAVLATVLFPVLAPRGAGGLAQRVDFLFVFGWLVVVAYRLPRTGSVIHGSLAAEGVRR